MNALTVYLSDEQKTAVEKELVKLFLFHDRPLNDEKKFMLVEQLISFGYPFAAIMGGFRKLIIEDLKRISLYVIKDAIEDCIEPETQTRENCDDCMGVGAIIMRDETSYKFALACRCGNAKPKLIRWNGDNIQFSNGRKLERV